MFILEINVINFYIVYNIIYIIYSFAETFTFKITDVTDENNPIQLIFYGSRNEFLYGNTDGNFTSNGGFIFDTNSLGKLTIYVNTPYAKCEKNAYGKKQTAIYTTGGGDNVFGNNNINNMEISRTIYRLEKKTKKSQWKIINFEPFVKTFQIINISSP